MGTLLERQGHKARAWCIQVFINTALSMDAVETTHHVAVHHVDNRFCDGVIESLVGNHTFLDDDFIERLTVFDHAHFVACFAVDFV